MAKRTYILRYERPAIEYNNACRFLDERGFNHKLLVDDKKCLGWEYTFEDEDFFTEFVLIYG